MGLLAAAIGGVAATGALADAGDPAPTAAKSAAHQQQRPTENEKKDSADKAKKVAERSGGTAKAPKETTAGKKKPAAAEKKPAAKQQAKVTRKPAPPAPPAPPKDPVERWISNAIDIMRKKGVPVSTADTDEIRTVIEKESSADPRAINLWDSNAAKGTPSKGLMQTIDPTFDAYKLPGYNDIYNPVDNIIAGVRYTLARYGSFAEHPGLASMAQGGDYRGY